VKNRDFNTSRPHDALFKSVFGRTAHAAALFRNMLPASVSAAIAWDTLELQPGSYIDRRLSDSHSDLLFSVRIDGHQALIYVLIEHQSTVRRDMPLRMLEPLVLIWKRHRQEHEGAPLPLIIPLLLSHAPDGWTGPLTLAELFEPHPDSIPGLAELIPSFSLLLDDLAHLSNEQLKRRALDAFPKLALWLMRDARNASIFLDNFAEWTEVFRAALRAPDGMEAVMLLLRYISIVCDKLTYEDIHAKIVEQLPEAGDAAMTIAEQFRQEGRVETLEQLLAIKFGELEPRHVAQIEAASIEQLNRYIERIFCAATVDEVLAEPH
jgi:predicted transposase YdaD